MQDSLHTIKLQIFLMNAYHRKMLHSFIRLQSAFSSCLMTKLINPGLQNDFIKNILHAITWMLLSMTGSKWGLSLGSVPW